MTTRQKEWPATSRTSAQIQKLRQDQARETARLVEQMSRPSPLATVAADSRATGASELPPSQRLRSG